MKPNEKISIRTHGQTSTVVTRHRVYTKPTRDDKNDGFVDEGTTYNQKLIRFMKQQRIWLLVCVLNCLLSGRGASSFHLDTSLCSKKWGVIRHVDNCRLCPTTATYTATSLTLRSNQHEPHEEQPLANQVVESITATPKTTLLDAASSVTLEQCRLLGAKSIGVDYGLVRTGVAVTVGYDPKPLAILSGLNNTQVSYEILQFARTEQALRIIVGLPLHKNGTVAEQTNVTLVFAKELARVILTELGPNVPVELWDERYTSKEAAARAHAQDPNRFLYGSLDAEAACIILEHYYNDNGQGRILVPLDNSIRAECLEKYDTKQSLELQRRLNATLEREERIQRRKDTIAQMQRLEAERGEGIRATKKKKKKKKRK